jgi:hypothetical protein
MKKSGFPFFAPETLAVAKGLKGFCAIRKPKW